MDKFKPKSDFTRIIQCDWKENVTVIAAKPIKGTGDYHSDYEICTCSTQDVQFFKQLPFDCGQVEKLPSSNLHQTDFSPEWRPILGSTIIQQYGAVTPVRRPPIIIDNMLRKNLPNEKNNLYLPSRVALRICAVRCLFQAKGKASNSNFKIEGVIDLNLC